jgi:acetyl-CoA carboxylase carboxyltransferase component
MTEPGNSEPGREGGPEGAGEAAGWTPEVAQIRRRRELAQAMGGPEKIDRQRATGRLTVRERIARLADPGSFAEIGALAGFGDYAPDGRPPAWDRWSGWVPPGWSCRTWPSW